MLVIERPQAHLRGALLGNATPTSPPLGAIDNPCYNPAMHRLVVVPVVSVVFLAGGCMTTPSRAVEIATRKTRPPFDPTTQRAVVSRIELNRAIDPDVAEVNLTPKDISVEDLVAAELPPDFKGNLEDSTRKRIGAFERTTFRLKGFLKTIMRCKDGDFVLLVAGNSGTTVTVEIPDPAQYKGSPLAGKIVAVRYQIEARYNPSDSIREIDQPVTLEGVGFYGWSGRPLPGDSKTVPRLMPGTGFKPTW